MPLPWEDEGDNSRNGAAMPSMRGLLGSMRERNGASHRITQTLPGQTPDPGARQQRMLPSATPRTRLNTEDRSAPHPALAEHPDDPEPDFEHMMDLKHERHRPDWA